MNLQQSIAMLKHCCNHLKQCCNTVCAQNCLLELSFVTSPQVRIFIFVADNTVKPPIGDHSKCEELVFTYQRWSLMRVKLQEVFYEEKSGNIRSRFWRECVHLETFLDNNNIICKSMLFVKVCLLC